jgi:hypothetical protein
VVGLTLAEDGFRILDSFISFVQDASLNPDVSLLWIVEIATLAFGRPAMTYGRLRSCNDEAKYPLGKEK